MSPAARFRFSSASLALLALVLAAPACDTRPETTARCSVDADCTSRQRCVASRCVPRDAEGDAATGDTDATLPGLDASMPADAASCDPTVDRCADAAAPTRDAGPCEGSASTEPCPDAGRAPDAGCADGDPACRTDASTTGCRRNGMVCGSDGRTYESHCAAEEAGVSVAAETPCVCRPDGASCASGQHCFGGFVHGGTGSARACEVVPGEGVCLAPTTTPGMCPTPLRAWGCDTAVSDGPVDPCSLPDGVVFAATLGCETRGAGAVGTCFQDGDCPADSACYGGTGCSDVAQGRCTPRPRYPACLDDRDCPVTQVCGAAADGTAACVRR